MTTTFISYCTDIVFSGYVLNMLYILKICGSHLTSNHQDDSTGHGNAGLFALVITTTISALHSHGGHTKPKDCDNDAHDHQSSCGLESAWVEQGKKNGGESHFVSC